MAVIPVSGIYSNGDAQVFWAADAVVDDDIFGAYTLVQARPSAYDGALEHASTNYPGWYANHLATGGAAVTDPNAGTGEVEEEEPMGMGPLSMAADAEPPEVYDASDDALSAEPDDSEQRGVPGAPENRAEPFVPENRAATGGRRSSGPSSNIDVVKKPGSAEAKMEGATNGD